MELWNSFSTCEFGIVTPAVAAGLAVLQELDQQDNIPCDGKQNPKIKGSGFANIMKPPDADCQRGHQNGKRPQGHDQTPLGKICVKMALTSQLNSTTHQYSLRRDRPLKSA